ncbi:TPA: hypothetical protein MDF34_004928 [Klebsiella pneumoniae]|nr:hypothetical protein [Klebsiella pneumoniae subsp. pneumoniae]PAX10234.1 hypothetical protein BVX91_27095 [Klebsiella pneumoniae]HBZ9029158.1 hypothetical protein [Raoultella ornithinolytica]PIK02902.1 hypothetical protein CR533_27095 [Klebsiella pneumoniae]HBS0549692.1 hypothetical protein [Klebsiella pneumoniae]
MSRTVPFEVLMHAENALSESECAMSVLSMWIDSIPDGEEHREEACRVGAIMSLLHNSIGELVKAREAYSEKRA